ncbi:MULTISPECIES: NTP transferase domain-containing protein [Microbacterium]|uniref:nucleotidyltransferase family protein n=1 Tax=Microbacterium TaxID=33882 RepID=UPI001E5F32AC|nr:MULTISPECIES: NTP transferase domain-containing protein [Microbacterium]|tara:strand:- start:14920 stop:15534 length:615 start_codon:yes stop_codon:yes gene_type:complete
MGDRAVPIVGLVLAAGAGTRFGAPKGLARDAAGTPWLVRAVQALSRGGCDRVLVAVGARGDEVAGLVPAGAEVVHVADWAAGLSATLRAGLVAANGAAVGGVTAPGVTAGGVAAVVVLPVDVPDAPAAAVRRVIDAAGTDVAGALVQASYAGAPGHPVLLGGRHLDEIAQQVAGDDGARAYLRAHAVTRVDCGDLWSGADIDTP